MMSTFDAVGDDLATHGFEREQLGGGLVGWVFESTSGTTVVTDDGDALLVGFYPGDNWGRGEWEDADMLAIDLPAVVSDAVAQILASATKHHGNAPSK